MFHGQFNQDNLSRAIKRALKYLVEGFAVAVAAYYIPKKMLTLKEITAVALTAAFTFAILDIMAPDIAGYARTGAGFGIGASYVGF
jgi:hypothetical protein